MKQVSRRQAMAAMGAAGTCACGLNAGCATFSKKGHAPQIAREAYTVDGRTVRIALEQVPGLSAVGGSAKIIDERLPTPLIIGRTGETAYAAVSLLCPHRGVEVEYRHGEQQFRCASLGHSTFNADGALKKGFARSGLTRYVAALDPESPACLKVMF
jgi:Rieske Fe-S protein